MSNADGYLIKIEDTSARWVQTTNTQLTKVDVRIIEYLTAEIKDTY